MNPRACACCRGRQGTRITVESVVIPTLADEDDAGPLSNIIPNNPDPGPWRLCRKCYHENYAALLRRASAAAVGALSQGSHGVRCNWVMWVNCGLGGVAE